MCVLLRSVGVWIGWRKVKRALSATERCEPVPTKQLKLLDLDDDSHDEDTNEAIQEDVPVTVKDSAVVPPQIYKNRRFNSFFLCDSKTNSDLLIMLKLGDKTMEMLRISL